MPHIVSEKPVSEIEVICPNCRYRIACKRRRRTLRMSSMQD